MSSEWSRVQLGSLIKHKKGFAFKSKDYLDKGIPVIRVSNFTEDSISDKNLKYVSKEIAAANGDVELCQDDIVIATVGSWPNNPESVVGRTICVPSWAKKALMNQNSVIIRAKSMSEIDQKFIYYQLKGEKFSQHVISKAQGSANQASITLESIFSYELSWPLEDERKAVVEVLSGFDKRITLHRQMNVTLEAIAQSLFKSWFIDFDPVRAKAEGRLAEGIDAKTAALFPDAFEETELGSVPHGWCITTLDNAYEINPARRLKKGERSAFLDMANVPVRGHHPEVIFYRKVGSGSKFINGDTLLARITPCLQNGKTAYVDFLSDNQVGWVSTEFVVLRPKLPLPLYHGYLLSRHNPFREFAIKSMSGTSGRQRIQNDVLGRYPVVVPSRNVAEKFGEIVTMIQQKITENSKQAKVLADLRDTLLPHLISGELQIPVERVT